MGIVNRTEWLKRPSVACVVPGSSPEMKVNELYYELVFSYPILFYLLLLIYKSVCPSKAPTEVMTHDSD